MAADALASAILRLAHGGSLSADDAGAAFDVVMSGTASAAQIAALLVGLRVKGESAAEVAGAARALQRVMLRVTHPTPDLLVDTCGTGGGSLGTFNISTAAAIVAAGAGVPLAKHGNRSFTSRSGSADVLEALGVSLEVPLEAMGQTLREAGIVFMFAPVMHPAMRHVGPVRRELAIPTIMNLLGPLANPAGARRQVIGVADVERLPLIADALVELGTFHALVVHGAPGIDELSPLGTSRIIEVRGGRVREFSVEPRDFGIGAVDPISLAGGSPEENARVIVEILTGTGNAGATAAVLLNAAAAINVSGKVESLIEGFELAQQAIKSGAALAALDRLRKSQRPADSAQ